MLVIKRVNGQVKYAFDPAAKVKIDIDQTPILVPKLSKPRHKKDVSTWYHEHSSSVDSIIDSYIELYSDTVEQNKKYMCVLDELTFSDIMIHKLYSKSFNTNKHSY